VGEFFGQILIFLQEGEEGEEVHARLPARLFTSNERPRVRELILPLRIRQAGNEVIPLLLCRRKIACGIGLKTNDVLSSVIERT